MGEQKIVQPTTKKLTKEEKEQLLQDDFHCDQRLFLHRKNIIRSICNKMKSLIRTINRINSILSVAYTTN